MVTKLKGTPESIMKYLQKKRKEQEDRMNHTNWLLRQVIDRLDEVEEIEIEVPNELVGWYGNE